MSRCCSRTWREHVPEFKDVKKGGGVLMKMSGDRSRVSGGSLVTWLMALEQIDQRVRAALIEHVLRRTHTVQTAAIIHLLYPQLPPPLVFFSEDPSLLVGARS